MSTQRRQRVRHGNTGLERIAAWKCHAVRGAVSVSQACCAALRARARALVPCHMRDMCVKEYEAVFRDDSD
jgi:hypothetical protein